MSVLKLFRIKGLGILLSNLRVSDSCKMPKGTDGIDVANMENIEECVKVTTVATTGTTLTFLKDRVYGSKSTPETGNITASITGALLGVTNLIIHNHSAEPTLDAKFKALTGSSAYIVGSINYIFCTYIADDEIIYSIQQRT